MIARHANSTLRLLSYNIRYDNAEDEYPWESRRDHLVSILRFHRPDIIGLQEALPAQVADIDADLPGYDWVGASRDGGDDGELTPLFYRADRLGLEWSRTRWLSQEPDVPGSRGWDADTPRTVVAALLTDRTMNRRLRVYNTHFDNHGKIALEHSVDLIREWAVADASEDGEPSVVLGDLNMTEGSGAYSRLTEMFSDAIRSAVEPRFGPDYTYVGPGFRVAERPGTRYDYILTGAGVRALRSATLTDSLHGRYPSDHLPIMSDVVLDLEAVSEEHRRGV